MEQIIAQASIIASAEKMNVLYVGVDNPMTFVFPGVECEDVVPEIVKGKGEIIATKECGKYIAHVEFNNGEPISFTAKINVNGKMRTLLNPVSFRVKLIPNPVAALKGDGFIYSGAKITKEELLQVQSLVSNIRNFDFDIKMQVISYDFSCISEGKIKGCNVKGNQITEEIKNIVRWMRPGARIYIENIKIMLPDGSNRFLETLLLEIKE